MTRRTWLGSPLAALGLAREATSPKSTELEDRKPGPKPITEGMLAPGWARQYTGLAMPSEDRKLNGSTSPSKVR